MTATAVSRANSEGTQERCDARCHNARPTQSDGKYGGRYRGYVLTGTFEAII